MTVYILAALTFIWCGPAAYFDINSTKGFLKRKAASEGGALGFMAAMQAKFPTAWPWVKTVLMWAIAAGDIWFMPMKWAAGILALLNVVELCAILSNYAVSKS